MKNFATNCAPLRWALNGTADGPSFIDYVKSIRVKGSAADIVSSPSSNSMCPALVSNTCVGLTVPLLTSSTRKPSDDRTFFVGDTVCGTELLAALKDGLLNRAGSPQLNSVSECLPCSFSFPTSVKGLNLKPRSSHHERRFASTVSGSLLVFLCLILRLRMGQLSSKLTTQQIQAMCIEHHNCTSYRSVWQDSSYTRHCGKWTRHTPQQGCDLSLSQHGYGWEDDNDLIVKLTNSQGLVKYHTTAMHDAIATKSMVCYMLVHGLEVLIRLLGPLRGIRRSMYSNLWLNVFERRQQVLGTMAACL